MKYIYFILFGILLISCENKGSHKDAVIFLNSVIDTPEFDSAMSRLLLRGFYLKNEMEEKDTKLGSGVLDSLEIQNNDILKNIDKKIDQLNSLTEFDSDIDLKAKSIQYHSFLKNRYNAYAKFLKLFPTGFKNLTPEQKDIMHEGEKVEKEGNQTGKEYAYTMGAFVEKYNISDAEF